VRVADEPGYRGEAYLEGAADGAHIREWTMARVVVTVRPTGEGRLVLNQNYFTGWRARIHGSGDVRSAGAQPNASGLVSVNVRPDDREVELYYYPNSFVWGSWISGLTLAGCVWLLRRFARSAAHARVHRQRGRAEEGA
jgi:uncharacterized membrane protein YfhO